MIFIELIGGLGNQMFQLAAATALAEEKKTAVSMVLSQFDRKESDSYTERQFELKMAFGLHDIPIATENKYLYLLRADPFSKVKRKLLYGAAFYERNLKYDQALFNYPRNTYLQGYFQSEKYFKKYQNAIFNLFNFNQTVNQNTADADRTIESSNAIAIHIRRGDYVNKKNVNAIHGSLPLSYYQQALKTFKLPYHDLFFFSDDMGWVKENFRDISARSIHFIDWNKKKDAWQDLYLMSKCHHFVIANSSFSWWGAWLSQNPNKKVIAPKRWFNDGNKQAEAGDIVPDEWIKLDC